MIQIIGVHHNNADWQKLRSVYCLFLFQAFRINVNSVVFKVKLSFYIYCVVVKYATSECAKIELTAAVYTIKLWHFNFLIWQILCKLRCVSKWLFRPHCLLITATSAWFSLKAVNFHIPTVKHGAECSVFFSPGLNSH